MPKCKLARNISRSYKWGIGTVEFQYAISILQETLRKISEIIYNI